MSDTKTNIGTDSSGNCGSKPATPRSVPVSEHRNDASTSIIPDDAPVEPTIEISDDKVSSAGSLKKININELPEYISTNASKFKDWID